MTAPTRPRPRPAPPRPRARCAEPDVDPDWWHPDPDTPQWLTQLAVALCHQCPLRRPCRAEGLANSHLSGVWGGLTGRARRRIRRQLQEVTTDA